MKLKKAKSLLLVLALALIFEFSDIFLKDEIVPVTKNLDNLDMPLKVHYLDVGQGDSIFIELPNGENALIDAGEAREGSKVVNYLKSLQVTKIDYLFATHPHSDHIGGLKTVIENYEIGKIYMPKVTANTNVYLKLLEAIESKGLKITAAHAGMNIIDNEDLHLDILAPVSSNYDDLNNYSIVLKLTYQTRAFLFMGDAETLSEKEITTNLEADVLKVGHHGSTSSTSKAFLNKVDPKIAVISVGKDNDYGHPKETILNRLENSGVKIYRTDLNGTIIIGSDGTSLEVKTENGSDS